MKRLSLIISALLRVAACVVCRVLTIALYVPYTVICALPKLFEALCSGDNWEMFEALMQDITYKPFRQYDVLLSLEVESEHWCQGYDTGYKTALRDVKEEKAHKKGGDA